VEIVLIVVLLLLVLALLGWVGFLEYRHRQLANSFRMLMTGRGGADLEATLMDFVSRMDHVEQVVHSVDQRVNSVEILQPYHIQHVGIVRFNPFSDKGGDQSFAIAILDDHADGIVLSSMQSRTDNRVYGKPVVGGQSTYTLGNEEREAIARAMKPRA
jgi:hypothetical protein